LRWVQSDQANGEDVKAVSGSRFEIPSFAWLFQMGKILLDLRSLFSGDIIFVNMKFLLLLAICLSSIALLAGTNPIQINEVMSSNGGSLTDLSGETPDWIELYNSGSNPINLEGYGFTDKKEEPFQWSFPKYTLQPGKYLIVFASGKNLRGSEFHTNFKIDVGGESVYLFNPGWSVVDSVEVVPLKINTSYGRTNTNPFVWAIFIDSTPRKKNSDKSFPDENVGVPSFSIQGGVYSNSFKVKLTAPNKTDTIYYTTNGSAPSLSSSTYLGEFSITKTKIIKARIIKSGKLPGDIITNSYISYRSRVPVISISMDSIDLWDFNTGIYAMGPNPGGYPYFGANFWQDWEKPCHFEMMETSGNKVINVDAGIKIFGNWSRANEQKSMAVHCRNKYGAERMDYKIFSNRPFDEFYSIVLRNSGNDWNNTMFRDGLMTSLTVGLNFEQMAYRPSAIFLNGQYWGMLNIREKIDENFLASNRGINPDDVILLENQGEPIIGVADDWWIMYNFLERNSMAATANYEKIASQVDIESFIDYFASQIFYANHDWPGNNIRYWKTTDPASKWRWIMYDTDFGLGGNNSTAASNSLAFATDPNGPGWPNPPWSTLMLRKLLENAEFRMQFVNRFADLMNSTFLPERVNKVIDEKRDAISDEMTNHLFRWKAGNQTSWLSRVKMLNTFASARPGYVFGHIKLKFSFQSQQTVTVNTDSVGGTIQLNSLKLNKFPWKGSYFPNVPITLTAIPNAGYRFLKWEGITTNSNQQTISVAPKINLSLTAVFESDGSQYENIVINEISFNNNGPSDPGDWVEIYNKGKVDIDISGWKLTDADAAHQFVFAPNTWIKANEYLVVSNDLAKMNSVFGSVKNNIGTFNFGLGSQTDKVQLYSQYNQLIDEVSYSNVFPWKPFDLKVLWSLELSDPFLNNNLASSWVFSINDGTPGLHNTPYIPDAVDDLPLGQNTPELMQNYPNPFSEGTSIEFKLNKPGKYQLTILDVNGRIMHSMNDDDLLSNSQVLFWDGRDNSGKQVGPGVYIYQLESSGSKVIKRMVKI
jgi:hypothetical protein